MNTAHGKWRQVFLRKAILVRRAVAAILLWLCALGGAPAGEKISPNHAEEMAAGLKLFQKSVRRILVDNCQDCHGDFLTEGELSLLDRKSLLKGGASGPAIVPGHPGKSLLMKLITHAEDPAMPKEASKLKKKEIAAIRQWIELGAPYDGSLTGEDEPSDWTTKEVPESAGDFWSFQPLSATAPPDCGDDADWCAGAIDRFVRQAQREKGLEPAPRASKRTLIRRATLDLLGVPPTPAEVKAFLADDDPMAYERLVERLLADERFGERWARYWLDVARFAESEGFEQDYDRPFAWHYRDFVIRAFNNDMPYDQFVRWQLAGDEIAPENPQAMMATGFVGAGVFPTQITKNEVERTRYDALDDMAATTGHAFLGLSVGCARCHDHKFDPIPQADYYRFISTFTTTVRSNAWLPIRPDVDVANGVAVAPKPMRVMIASEGERVVPIQHHSQGPPFLKTTHFLQRGDTEQKIREAPQGFLQVLTNHPDGAAHWQQEPPEDWRTSYRRRALADWIVDTEHGAGHLTARVIVNRLWQRHFGTGIVATPNDFGSQGARPTHPELLDWLAGELIDSGWRLKPIHRLIMTSAAYRQSSHPTADARNADPQNQWLTRFSPRRLRAEAIRDSILAVSGVLDRRMYGKGTLDLTSKRRSIYFTIKRSELIPTMTLFDAPEPTVSIGRRQTTTIAPQALFFMNSETAQRSARALALRLSREAPDAPLRRAYWLVYGRPPTSSEERLGRAFLDRQAKSYRADGIASPERMALADACQTLLASSEFLYLP